MVAPARLAISTPGLFTQTNVYQDKCPPRQIYPEKCHLDKKTCVDAPTFGPLEIFDVSDELIPNKQRRT